MQGNDVKDVVIVGQTGVADVEDSSTRLRLASMNSTAHVPEIEPVIHSPANVKPVSLLKKSAPWKRTSRREGIFRKVTGSFDCGPCQGVSIPC